MMLELKERVFARLDQLGFEEVWARRKRGEYLGTPQIVREWLELNDPDRRGEAGEPQKARGEGST